MTFLLSSLLGLAFQFNSAYKEGIVREQEKRACLANETCELIQRDGYSQIRMIPGAIPTDRFKCVREKTCTTRWDKESRKWIFEPITKKDAQFKQN